MTADEVRHEIDGATEMFAAWEKEHGIRVSPSIHFTGENPFSIRVSGRSLPIPGAKVMELPS